MQIWKKQLKILSDIDCHVCVGNELLVTMMPYEMAIVPLFKGESWVQCVCPHSSRDKIEQIVCVHRVK